MSLEVGTRTALITGASSGIGYEFAKVFGRNGWSLVLVARGGAKMKELAAQLTRDHAIAVTVIEKDLSRPEAAQELYADTRKMGLHIDALVNNAGIGTYGLFVKGDLEAYQRMLEINVTALTKLTRLYLGPMIEKKRGWILNVASTAGFQPGPLMAVYYASKAYVLSFSEALSEELKGSGVSATVICPGATDTGFKDAADMGHSKLFQKKAMRADQVAEEGYDAMMRRKTLFVNGFKNKLMAMSVRFAPRAIVPRVVRKIQESRS